MKTIRTLLLAVAVLHSPAFAAVSLAPVAADAGGQALLMPQEDADFHCRVRGMRLPTPRELAEWGYGAAAIRETELFDVDRYSDEAGEEIDRMFADGYQPVYKAGVEVMETVDFYVNEQQFRPREGANRSNWYRTSSVFASNDGRVMGNIVMNEGDGRFYWDYNVAEVGLRFVTRCVLP